MAATHDHTPHADAMRLLTTRFGALTVREQDIIVFPRGLVGFPEATRCVVIDPSAGGPFRWLQAVDRPDLAFAITDPLVFFKGYQITITAEELDVLAITDPADAVVAVILVVPRDPRETTANLQGPVMINTRARLGMQLVLSGSEYTTRQRIFSREDIPQGA